MQHGVAVRTYGYEVVDGVYNVSRTNVGKLYEMVNVDESFPNRSEGDLEIKPARLATGPVVFDALRPRIQVTFKTVYLYLKDSTFAVFL